MIDEQLPARFSANFGHSLAACRFPPLASLSRRSSITALHACKHVGFGCYKPPSVSLARRAFPQRRLPRLKSHNELQLLLCEGVRADVKH